MLAYILRRLMLVVPTLFGIMVVNFVIIQAAPGGPDATDAGPGNDRPAAAQMTAAMPRRKIFLSTMIPLCLRSMPAFNACPRPPAGSRPRSAPRSRR